MVAGLWESLGRKKLQSGEKKHEVEDHKGVWEKKRKSMEKKGDLRQRKTPTISTTLGIARE